MSDELCGALLWAAWAEFPIDVRCEREAGHVGDHSAERGEWGWAQNRAACVCGHLRVDHDLDDGCGGCAMHMVGPCREFRARPGIAPTQGGDVLDDLWWEAGK